jgi:hypothetical protein
LTGRRVLAAAVLASAAILLAVGAADAQLGIRGGLNLSRFVGEDAAADGRSGLNLGASLPLLHVSAFSIVPEVYYAQKGGVERGVGGSGGLEYELSYIEVPVLAKLSLPIPGARSIRAYVAGGPAFAWNLDCRVSSAAGADAAARDCGEPFQNIDTAMKSADRGAVFSGGLDFTVRGLGGLNLDARLVRGLARLQDGRDADVRNQAFSLMLGYYLGR